MKPEGEPITPEFRHEVVAKFCRDLSSGAVTVNWKKVDWDEDFLKSISDATHPLLGYINIFLDHEESPDKRKYAEDEIFRSVLFLRGNGIAKDTLNESEIQERLNTMDARFESMRKLTMELLTVMKEVVPKLEAIERKVDRL